MFDIGWSELLVIAVVAIVVVGPKDLPRMLRAFGQAMGKIRRMAGEFQSQFNEAMREAELEDVKRSIESVRDLNPARQIREAIDESLRGIEGPTTPAPGSTPASGQAAAADSAQASGVNGAPVELPPVPIPSEPPPPVVSAPPAEPVPQALPPQGVPDALNGSGQAPAEAERRVQP